MSRQFKENQHIPVPQGERGILREWPGQLRQLPPPSVGIMALTSHKRLEYSCTGAEQRDGHVVLEYGI